MFENYYKKVIQFDLINKFLYHSIRKFPQLTKIVLNFGCKSSDLKNLAPAFFSLNLITKKKSLVIKSKQTNILLKIRKGNIVGCKIVLKKNAMYDFFKTLQFYPSLNLILPPTNSFNKKPKKLCFSFTLKNFINFKEFKQQFYLFTLPPLNVTIIFLNITTKKELLYLLHSLKKI